MVLREDPLQSLDEAIRMWIDVAKASEAIDGTATTNNNNNDDGADGGNGGPGVGGTNIVGLIIHSSAEEMLPILKSVTAFDSSWPASCFLGAYVDVVLPLHVPTDSDGDDDHDGETPPPPAKAAGAAAAAGGGGGGVDGPERLIGKRPHGALGSGWQLKDGGGNGADQAAFVAAAYEWWEAGATAVGGAATAGVTRSELRALAPLRRPRPGRGGATGAEGTGQEEDAGGDAAEYLGLRDGIALHHHHHRHRDDDDGGEVPWWLWWMAFGAAGVWCAWQCLAVAQQQQQTSTTAGRTGGGGDSKRNG